MWITPRPNASHAPVKIGEPCPVHTERDRGLVVYPLFGRSDVALSRLQTDFPAYGFIRQYDRLRGFVFIGMRVSGSGGPCLVMTEDDDEMRALLGAS